jgi:hypothetical protein
MKRWPIIRHIRWLITAYKVERHYAAWLDLGYLPIHRHLDEERLDRIWQGSE